MKVDNNNQLYKLPAGDKLWNSGRQNWIFGRIGDQEGAISDPAYGSTYLPRLAVSICSSLNLYCHIFIHRAENIVTDTVANATNIFSLATKISGLVATLAKEKSKVKRNISSYLALLSS